MGSPGAHFGSKLGSTKGLMEMRHMTLYTLNKLLVFIKMFVH